jgi:hypothetical protein
MGEILVPWDIPEDELKMMCEAMVSGMDSDLREYMEHYEGLDRTSQARIGYAYAALRYCGPEYGGSGSRYASPKRTQPDAPFQFCGWGGHHNEVGPCFKIDPRCFLGREHLLFYSDQDMCCEGGNSEKEAKAFAEEVARRSSGLTDVRVAVMPRSCHDQPNEGDNPYYCVLFRLDCAAVKPAVIMNGRDVPVGETEGYVQVLPRVGEYWCDLGEIPNGDLRKSIPLYKDSFDMK